MARQPILDRKQNIYAYELLFRPSSPSNEFNGDIATAQVIGNLLDVVGIEELTGNRKAFINFTGTLIKEGLATILPNDQVGIEILETVSPDAEIIEACATLKEQGYLIVLDDFKYSPELKPLINLADIIKIDFLSTTPEERKDCVRRLDNGRIQFLAEKVETQEQFAEALDSGYSYFQGYFFHQPEMISRQGIPILKLNYLDLLEKIHKPEPDFTEIEKVIKNDVALSYKLLRLINSPFFGLRHEISSVKHALSMLGITETRKWLSLQLLQGLSEDKPDILLINSLIRSRFAEMLAPELGFKGRKVDLFLMGLFSMIDALLGRPLEEILARLPLATDVKKAILKQEGQFGTILRLMLYCERGEWDALTPLISELGSNSLTVSQLYLQSITSTNRLIAQMQTS